VARAGVVAGILVACGCGDDGAVSHWFGSRAAPSARPGGSRRGRGGGRPGGARAFWRCDWLLLEAKRPARALFPFHPLPS
jgi:hypothetical protein